MHGAFFIHKITAGPAETAGRLPYGDWPGKKESSRKEPDMKLQWLKEILGEAYTEEMDGKSRG